MADKFPSDFYVTCATVIPVLFLALAVQGQAYELVLRTSERAERYSGTTVWRASGLQPPRQRAMPLQEVLETLAVFAASFLWIIALAIVFAGGFGEVVALYVLYRGSEPADARTSVFVATLILLGAVLAGPLMAGARSLWQLSVAGPLAQVQAARTRQRKSDQARPAEAQSSESPKAGEGQAPSRTTEDSDS